MFVAIQSSATLNLDNGKVTVHGKTEAFGEVKIYVDVTYPIPAGTLHKAKVTAGKDGKWETSFTVSPGEHKILAVADTPKIDEQAVTVQPANVIPPPGAN